LASFAELSIAQFLASEQLKDGEVVTLAGLVTSTVTKIGRKSNKPYMIVSVEDFDAELQFMLMGSTLDQNRDLAADQVVALRGQVTTRDDGRSIRVYEITQIEGASEGENHPIELQIKDTQATKENLERLEKILENHGGFSKVILHMHSRSGGRSFELPKLVRYSNGFVAEIKGLFGLGALSQLAPVSNDELADDLAGQDVGALVVEQRLLFESE